MQRKHGKDAAADELAIENELPILRYHPPRYQRKHCLKLMNLACSIKCLRK